MGKDSMKHNHRVSPKVIKVLALSAAVLVQIAILILPYFFLREHIAPYLWIFQILSTIALLHILKSNQDPVYKLPWVILMLSLPGFGWIIFLIYGHIRFSKREKRRMSEITTAVTKALEKTPSAMPELTAKFPHLVPQATYLTHYARTMAFNDTQTEYFPLGDDFLPRLLQDLETAEKFIFMEYFIVEEGEMLNPILDILVKKAAEGVDVRFMYDSFGSIMKAPVHMIKDLESKNIKCVEFRSFHSLLDARYNNRDHRKITVIDGNIAYTGGVNLADEYINKKQVCGHWKDTAIRLEGSGAWGFTILFLALWDIVTPGQVDLLDYVPKNFPQPYFCDVQPHGFVIPFTDYPMDGESVGKNMLLNMISHAQRYLYITTPYLIIDNVLMTALENAAKCGVDVRIITPGIPDKKIVFLMTRSHYEPLIRSGVKIYEYTPGFVHAKTAVSDDEVGFVGTINLDFRSLTHHMEDGVWLCHTSTIPHIYKDFLDTQAKCHLVTWQESKRLGFWARVLMPFLKLVAPLM